MAALPPTYRALSQHMPTPHPVDRELLTVKQAATVLQISARSIRRLIADRDLASFKIRGVIRIRRSDIDRYLDHVRNPDHHVSVGE